jgi:hypothetical protein
MPELTKQEMFDIEWKGGVALNRFPQTDFEEKLDKCAMFPDRKFALRKLARDYNLTIPNGE